MPKLLFGRRRNGTKSRRLSLLKLVRDWYSPSQSLRLAPQQCRTSRLEQLEMRLLLAGYTTEWRSLDLTLTGNYSGRNPGTYLVGNPPATRDYLDVYRGSLEATGSVQYTSNTSGSGALPFGNSSGEGKDNFWKSYAYHLVGSMLVSDNAGSISGGATRERQLVYPSIQFYDPPTPGSSIKAKYQGMPPDLRGNWNPLTGAATLSYLGDFSFTGTVTPTVSGTPEIEINETTLKWGYNCVCVEVNVTGALARAAHTTVLGQVKAVWLNAAFEEIGTVFEEPVYWNTGTIKYSAVADAPFDAVLLKVTASIQEDSDTAVIAYSPDFMITDFDWGDVDGIKGKYKVMGGSAAGVPVSLYWSTDAKRGGDKSTGYSFFTTDQRDTDIPFSAGANLIIPPDADHQYLIMVIDDFEEWKECNEDNNFRTLAFTPSFDVRIQAGTLEALIRESYRVAYAVENMSKLEVVADIDMVSVTSVHDKTPTDERFPGVTLKPGESWVHIASRTHDWDWVSDQSPMEAPSWEEYFQAAMWDILSAMSDFADLSVKVKDALVFIYDAYGILTIPNIPRITVEERLSVHPRVASAPNPNVTTWIPHYVGVTKQNALLRYQLQASAIAATAFQINMIAPAAGSQLSTVLKHFLILLAGIEESWEQVKDPPDPNFRNFFPVSSATEDLTSLPVGLLREQARLNLLNEGFLKAGYRTVDKKDGATQASDAMWMSQQFADLAVLMDAKASSERLMAAYAGFLLPWQELHTASPQAAIDYWQAHDLPAELASGLQELGLSPSDLLASFRNQTAEANERYDSLSPMYGRKFESVASSLAAMDSLKSAIDLRVGALGYSPRALTTTELQNLQSYRDQLAEMETVGDFGNSYESTLSYLAAYAIRIGLESNNYVAVEEDLNRAYVSAFRSTGNSASIDNFLTDLATRNTAGEVSASLLAMLQSQAGIVRSSIAAGSWSNIAGQLATLRNLINSASAGDISATSKTVLLSRVEAMQALNERVPAFQSPTIGSVPANVTLGDLQSRVLSTSLTVTQPGLATFVGGHARLTVANPRNDAQWYFNDGAAFQLVVGDEISLDGVPVAQVVIADIGELELEFLADATPDRVRRLLTSVYLQLPTASQAWTSVMNYEVANGIGGSAQGAVTLTRPGGTPAEPGNQAPTAINLISNTVAENLPARTVIGALTATDADVGDRIAFALLAGQGNNDRFMIIGNQLRTSAPLNHEQTPTLTAWVRATDLAGSHFDAAITVSVTDVAEAPHSIVLSNSTVLEYQPVGTLVGTLAALDEDITSQSFTFSLVDSSESVDNANFTISGNSLLTTASFTRHLQSTYQVLIRATDTSGRSRDQWVTVFVGDINDAPSDIVLSNYSVPENSHIDTVVANLDGVDVDDGRYFRFELVSGVGADDNDAFHVYGTQLLTTQVLDYETTPTLSIRLRVTDRDGLAVEKIVVLQVDDRPDAPTSVRLSKSTIEAGLAGGSIVGTFSTPNNGAPESFTYNFVGGPGGENNTRFAIVGNQLRTLLPFEYTPGLTYSVRVRVADAFGGASERAFAIAVSPSSTLVDVDVVSTSAGTIAVEAGLDGEGSEQVLSDNGRFAVFSSAAENLVTGADTGGYKQVYLRDRTTGELRLISQGLANMGANGNSYAARISADGSRIVFLSEASDLISGASIVATSVYLYDVTSSTMSLVSHRSTGAEIGINDVSTAAALSLDGSKVVFATWATDVIVGVGDANSAMDLYLYDVSSGANTLISHRSNSSTNTANAEVRAFAISGDGTKVVYESYATNVVPGVSDDNFSVDLFLYDVATGSNTLVTRSASSATAVSEGGGFNASISYDGSRVAFESFSSNLTAGDSNFDNDIFLFSTNTGTNRLVSHRSNSTTISANAGSYTAEISRDGSRIVFESWATNLITGFSGSTGQVYVHNVGTNVNTLVSRASGSTTTGADGDSSIASLSADGQVLLYQSSSTNLVTGLVNPENLFAFFVYSLGTGTTQLVTHSPGAPLVVTEANLYEGRGLSADGSTVLLSSYIPLDNTVTVSEGSVTIYDYSVATNQHVAVAKLPSSTTAAAESTFSDMSLDGRYVVFVSAAPNIVPGQINNGGTNIFLLDRNTDEIRLVSHAPGIFNQTAFGNSTNARISGNGTMVVYEFYSYDTYQTDIYLYDVASGVNKLVSHPVGMPNSVGNAESFAPRLSDDGNRILFESRANNLVSGVNDSEGTQDVFLYDDETGLITLVSHQYNSLTIAGNGTSYSGEISGDGTRVVFTSYATNLSADPTNDTNNGRDVFVYDVASGEISLVSHASNSTIVAANDWSDAPSISRDGMKIVFETQATNVVSGLFEYGGVYIYDVITGQNLLINHRFDDPNAHSGDLAAQARISEDGSRVVFQASGTDLVSGFVEQDGYSNIYVYEVATGANTLVSHNGLNTLLEVNYNSFNADISGDGSAIIWMTWGDDVVHTVYDRNTGRTETNGYGDVYRYDIATGRNVLISRTIANPNDAGDEDSTTGSNYYTQGRLLSHDGRVAVFESVASDIASGDTNGLRDVFVAQLSSLPARSSLSLTGGIVAENQPAGTMVGTLNSADPVAFTFADGDGDLDNSSFALAPNGTLTLAAPLDFERSDGSYQIRVRATGANGVSREQQFTILVTDVNDPPTLNAFGNYVLYNQGGLPQPIARLIRLSDVDSTNLSGGVLTITLINNSQSTDVQSILTTGVGLDEVSTAGAAVSVGGVVVGTFSGGTNNLPLTVSLNTAATPARVQILLRAVAFSSTAPAPSNLVRTLRVALSDGDGGTSAPVTKLIHIVAMNSLLATVVARHIFYNNSAYDFDSDPLAAPFGIGSINADANDDFAIAPDKAPLLPGGTATFENYTNFSKGINGIMIDINNLSGTPTIIDFQFRVGNDNTPDSWTLAPTPSDIIVRLGAGVGGSDRVMITWPNNAIQKTWLQVTVLPTSNTGLIAADVFYFGNAIGETGDGANVNAFVNATDRTRMLNNARNFLNRAPITNLYDTNRDSLVDATDRTIALNNSTNFLNDLNLITVPPAGGGSGGSSPMGSSLVTSGQPFPSPVVSSTGVPAVAGSSYLANSPIPLSDGHKSRATSLEVPSASTILNTSKSKSISSQGITVAEVPAVPIGIRKPLSKQSKLILDEVDVFFSDLGKLCPYRK